MWVMRSPAFNPASCAGLPSSTHCGRKRASSDKSTQFFIYAIKGVSSFHSWGWSTYPHHVMDSVDVTVSHIDPDGTQCKSKPLSRAVDDHGRPETADTDGQVPAGGRVSGRGVGRQGQGRFGAQRRSCWVIFITRRKWLVILSDIFSAQLHCDLFILAALRTRLEKNYQL